MGTVYLCAGLLGLALLGSICVLIVLVARLPRRVAALVQRERAHAATQGWTAAEAALSAVVVGLRRFVEELAERADEHGPTLPTAPPVDTDDETTLARPQSQALPRAAGPEIPPPPMVSADGEDDEEHTKILAKEGTPAAAPGAPREAHAILPGQTNAPPRPPRAPPPPPPRRTGPPREPSR